MARRIVCGSLLGATGAALVLVAPPVAANEYTCSFGASIRRVEIASENPQTGLPCEVVYWKDTEAPGERQVLWNARTDAGFCRRKAQELADTLSQGGWECTASDAAAPQEAQTPARSETAGAPAAADPAERDVARRSEPSADLPNAAGQTPPDMDALNEIIAQNLQSLNNSVDGDFNASIADHGDLNGDGLQDAVVFFNYQSNGSDFTQFVAAYLYNGETYHLVATKPIGGTDRAVSDVEVEDIVDGSILLRLHSNDADPAESKRAAVVLQDGQLVETE